MAAGSIWKTPLMPPKDCIKDAPEFMEDAWGAQRRQSIHEEDVQRCQTTCSCKKISGPSKLNQHKYLLKSKRNNEA